MKMKPTSVIIADLGINPDGRIQRFFVDTCANHMDKYVPMRSGDLAGTLHKTNRSITYLMPYARYQYYGVSKSGKALKYSTNKHKDAGPYWDKRMVTAEIQNVVAEVQNEIKRGS